MVELTRRGSGLLEAAPSLLQDRFRHELAKLEQWERTLLLASLQRIAAMMEAEQIEAVPVLSTGVVSALPEDMARYLEEAVKPGEETAQDSPGLLN